MDFTESGRVLVVFCGDDVRAKVGGFFHFLRRIGEIAPSGDISGYDTGNPLDRSKLVGAGPQDLFCRVEGVEQTAQAHRSHLRDHVQGNAGLKVVHRKRHAKLSCQGVGILLCPAAKREERHRMGELKT